MPLVRSAVVESSQFRVLVRVAQVRGGPLEKRIRSVVCCRPSLAPGTRVGAKGAESCGVDGSVSHELARSPASAFENKLGVHIRGNEVPDPNARDQSVVAIHRLERKMVVMAMVMMMVSKLLVFIVFIIVLLIFIDFLIKVGFTVFFFEIRLVELGETEQSRQHGKNIVERVIGIKV
jgi:hypothetical protein